MRIAKLRKIVSLWIVVNFICTTIVPPSFAQTVFTLPAPGTFIPLSPSFTPAIINGMTIHPDNPLHFDFIIDIGDDKLSGKALEEESKKLIHYFMASLTVPEKDMWVNLSPYEGDQMIAEGLGNTLLGRDMLAQDYILKQLTASLMVPDGELGKEFWKRVYEKAQAKFGTTEIPVDTFHKIWIIPDKAVVYVKDHTVFVADAHLKVLLEDDYLAMQYHEKDSGKQQENLTEETKAILREVFLPEIEREVNEGKNFASLRQIYNSLILATWYKKNLKKSLLGEVYVNQNKVNGVEIDDKDVKHKIYNQYVEAFKKGVYDEVKEEYDAATQEVIPRRYFSGGAALEQVEVAQAGSIPADGDLARRAASEQVGVSVDVQLGNRQKVSASLTTNPDLSVSDLDELAKQGRVLKADDKEGIATWNKIAERLLWISTRMIHEANVKRPEDGDRKLKVGGHQAAAASSLHLMVALELFAMTGVDQVAHKPHSGPVYHAMQYLFGKLPKEALFELRNNPIQLDETEIEGLLATFPDSVREEWRELEAALLETLPDSAKTNLDRTGLHSYPGMADPDGVKIPTGSVGMGPAIAITLAIRDQWLRDHGFDIPDSHYFAVLGDAESDEGNLLESLALAQDFDVTNVTHVLDFNRQSLDGNISRVIEKLNRIKARWAANGWQIIELHWGNKIKEAFANGTEGQDFQSVMESLDLNDYQLLTAKSGKDIKEELLARNPELIESLDRFFAQYSDEAFYELFTDLGGHDLAELTQAYAFSKKSKKPTLIVAHTIKGKGLRPLVGDPANHSKPLAQGEIDQLGQDLGIPQDDPFPAFDPASAEGQYLEKVKARLGTEEADNNQRLAAVTDSFAQEFTANQDNFPQRLVSDETLKLFKQLSTQDYLGQIISRLRGIAEKNVEDLTPEEKALKPIADRFVTVSPDVATSTGLARKGKGGEYDASNPAGNHFRLSIAEMNAVTLAASLGKGKLFPLVTIYDMFLFRRALDPFFYGQYWKSRFIAVGTPSGSTLAAEGAQHQSIIAPVIGKAMPNTITWDPAFALELDFIMSDSLRRMATEDDEGRNAVYIRGTTLPYERQVLIDRLKAQTRYVGKTDDEIIQSWSQDVLRGGYRLIDYSNATDYIPNENVINIIATGPITFEAIAASDALRAQGIYANVIVVTSPDLLIGTLGKKDQYSQLKKLVPVNERQLTTMVTVADAPPSYLAGIGDILGISAGVENLGLEKNGLSARTTGRIYRHQGISRVDIARTAFLKLQSILQGDQTDEVLEALQGREIDDFLEALAAKERAFLADNASASISAEDVEEINRLYSEDAIPVDKFRGILGRVAAGLTTSDEAAKQLARRYLDEDNKKTGEIMAMVKGDISEDRIPFILERNFKLQADLHTLPSRLIYEIFRDQNAQWPQGIEIYITDSNGKESLLYETGINETHMSLLYHPKGADIKFRLITKNSENRLAMLRMLMVLDGFIGKLAEAADSHEAEANLGRSIREEILSISNEELLARYASVLISSAPVDGLSETVGGIDFNADKLNLQEQGDAFQFDIPSNLEGLTPANVNAIIPVIINIVPITNFPQLLGLAEPQDEPALSKL